MFPYTAEVDVRGRLSLGGCDAIELAAEFGTPLYVFDEDTLRGKCREFVDGFKSRYRNSSVIYACKAFINVALAQLLLDEGLGLDVVSGGELAVALRAGFPPERIYFHGNNKSRDELAMALDCGIGRVVVDNFHEMSLLAELASERGVVQDITLRVSPGVDPHTHVYTTTGVLDSKFGFAIQTGDAQKAVESASGESGLRLVGVHFHLGSPIFELEPYTRAMEISLEFASMVGLPLAEISPGGGFAIAYTRDQEPPPVEAYAEAISAPLPSEGGPHLVVEPGRAIVGRAGVALYSAGAVKDVPGVRRYVSVDGGMGDNIRPALYQAQYEAVIANKMVDEEWEAVSVAGKFCESGDVLLRDVLIPRLEPGDILAVPASGAYAPAMASNYNLVPRPAIVMVKDGRARLIRRRETYEDLMRHDVV
ncbi:MAG: diaminopimelate decarboxylase [Chloroflexota bacterium]|nr:diaminopimelate decarboxylase [Chloroflexota bacterium]MDE2942183.1 diaminopimelate decarboxylase [Chloroflexota bacterium]MDE3267516.1 diaminopimelate decarboxylase [Chloroflexota bacterium]